MTTESGGLSKDEFLLVQEQLLQLRQENYELREDLKKKIAQPALNSPKNEALQFASKLINRASSSKNSEKDGEIDALRRKLETQEEEFRLQQSTLFEELKNLSTQNESLKTQMASYSDHPLENEMVSSQTVELSEEKYGQLKKENEFFSQEVIPNLNQEIKVLKEQLENCKILNVELEDRVLRFSEESNKNNDEKTLLESQHKTALEENDSLKLEISKKAEEFQRKNQKNVEEIRVLTEEKLKLVQTNSELQNEITSKTSEISVLEAQAEHLSQKLRENDEIITKFEKMQAGFKQVSVEAQTKIDNLKSELDTAINEKVALSAEIAKNLEETSKNQDKLVEDRILLLETRYQLEVDDQNKSFEAEKEELLKKIKVLENQMKASEEEKKAALKKQKAMMKELQKTLREERKRADSYERKSEERAGWHMVPPENDGQSSHTFDGNESVSSLSAIESENVELITRLATLQKINSENADTILQLESENSRLRREVTEKGELIENLIREKPLGAGFSSQPGYPPNQPKLEVSFRKLLNTLGQDSNTSDVKEMNKKLQRMLEETLSKNIILQRDLQTLMERTGM